MIQESQNLLGIGLYTPAEAAYYARVRTRTMNRWLFGDRQGDAVLAPQLNGAEEKTVTFLDFVQALAVRAIRVHHKIPLSRIRQAYESARDNLGIEYPFAVRHHSYLFGDLANPRHCEVLIRLDGQTPGRDEFVQVTGKQAGNRMLAEVVELYMKDLVFGDDGLASEYRAWSDGRYAITMHPDRRFGEPLVTSCGYTARALFESYHAEGGVKAAAEAYGVACEEVELACSYIDHLQGNSAA